MQYTAQAAAIERHERSLPDLRKLVNAMARHASRSADDHTLTADPERRTAFLRWCDDLAGMLD